MNWLAIDTSTEHASIALAVGQDVFYQEQDNIREHASCLLPMVEGLFVQTGLSIKQLKGIIYGRGPGSFTGLRIACSVVKGLAYPHDLPVYPVSGLLAIAHELFHSQPDLPQETRVLAMVDARMQEIYWGCYRRDSIVVDEHVTSPSQVICPSNVPLVFAGVGFDDYVTALPESVRGQCLTQYRIYPDARAMLRWVQQGHVEPVSAAEALPVYVRNQVVHVRGGTHG